MFYAFIRFKVRLNNLGISVKYTQDFKKNG